MGTPAPDTPRRDSLSAMRDMPHATAGTRCGVYGQWASAGSHAEVPNHADWVGTRLTFSHIAEDFISGSPPKISHLHKSIIII